MNAVWTAWYERMKQAEARGESFNEPPPSAGNENSREDFSVTPSMNGVYEDRAEFYIPVFVSANRGSLPLLFVIP